MAELSAAPAAAEKSAASPPLVPLVTRNESVRHELEHAIDRGLAWLATNQNSNGWWSGPEQPAVTALALSAFQGRPGDRSAEEERIQRGYRFLLSCVQPDGGIHRSNLVTYNTSISIMALLAAQKADYEEIIIKARQFLVGLQRDFGEKGKLDDPYDGGVGYGSRYEHSDMGNTLVALEALHHSRFLINDRAGTRDLNWAAAIQFLQNCQNLPASNRQAWASDDSKNKGGFIYYPGHSMAGSETNSQTGRVALRSYGSISYAGLLSYLYANLKRDDPRVQAVFQWLRNHYTLQENPGLGPQGFYFYLHTMSKALSAYGVDQLELTDGKKIDWRKEAGLRLLDLQQRDGSWVNDNARWWEKDPALVTSYAVLTLEILWRGL